MCLRRKISTGCTDEIWPHLLTESVQDEERTEDTPRESTREGSSGRVETGRDPEETRVLELKKNPLPLVVRR